MTVLISGTASAIGASAEAGVFGYFNISISGTFVANVQLQRKLPGQTTFNTVVEYSEPSEESPLMEVEDGTLYRFYVSSYSSGTISYRMSQGLNKFMVRG